MSLSSLLASLPSLPGKPDAKDECLRHCDSDPTGNRAMQDWNNYDRCPVQEILTGDVEHTTKVEDAFKVIEKNMKRHAEIGKVGTSNTYALVENIAEKMKSWKFFDIKDMDEQETKKSMHRIQHDPKAVKAVAGWFVLADMFADLNKIPGLRRAAMYQRRVDVVKKFNDKDVVQHIDGVAVKTPWYWKMYYIFWPCFLFFMSFGFQSFMLHIATHFYIFYMDHGPDNRRDGGGQLLDLVGNFVGEQLASNPDETGAVTEGAVQIPTKILDLSGVIPLFLCVSSFLLTGWKQKFNIGLWTKTFIVASSLAVLKGVFDVVTILPDSIGWDSCKDRLGHTGLNQLRGIQFIKHGWDALFTAMWHEIVGGADGRRVRYCADMMISGHTYFAVLFAKSAYKQVSFLTEGGERKHRLGRQIVGIVCLCCISTEVLLVAAARFHYTVDMLASIVLVLLLWDSCTVEQIAADWSEGFHWQDPNSFIPHFAPISAGLRQLRFGNKNEPPKPKVLASQSSCMNLRVLQGCPAWTEPTDKKAASPTSTSGGMPTARPEEQMPFLQRICPASGP